MVWNTLKPNASAKKSRHRSWMRVARPVRQLLLRRLQRQLRCAHIAALRASPMQTAAANTVAVQCRTQGTHNARKQHVQADGGYEHTVRMPRRQRRSQLLFVGRAGRDEASIRYVETERGVFQAPFFCNSRGTGLAPVSHSYKRAINLCTNWSFL